MAALRPGPMTGASCPRLARKARLRPDPPSGRTLLLFPEHGLELNDSAAAILALCDGRPAAEIARTLAAPLDDVLAFLDRLGERGLVTA
jgi:pyrroloquinoline quinone biosynthesis protein D